jgi:DNA-binding CsgD family transcriptional regulator
MDSFLRIQPIWLVQSEKDQAGTFQSHLPPPLDRLVKLVSLRSAVALLERKSKPPLILIEGRPDKAAQNTLAELKEAAPDVPVFLLSQWHSAEDLRSWSSLNVVQMMQQEKTKSLDRTNAYKLSGRELQILQFMVKGLIKKEIAEQLSISYYTVDNHERSIFKKMNVHTRSAAVARALIERIC